MNKSIVVELWNKHEGVVGIYRVALRRSLWQALCGEWSVGGVDRVEGSVDSEATSTVAVMVAHGLTDMNGWLLRRL